MSWWKKKKKDFKQLFCSVCFFTCIPQKFIFSFDILLCELVIKLLGKYTPMEVQHCMKLPMLIEYHYFLQGLDKKLLKLNKEIQEDERISSNAVVKMVYGDPVNFLSQLPKDSHIHHSKMWSCRKRISVENLGHIVQQNNAKDTVPLLWKFLQKVSAIQG